MQHSMCQCAHHLHLHQAVVISLLLRMQFGYSELNGLTD